MFPSLPQPGYLTWVAWGTENADRGLACALTVVAVVAGLAGCSSDDSTPSASSATSVDPQAACTSVDAQMVEIPTPYSAEPLVRIPQPAGWERSGEFDKKLYRMALLDSDSSDPQNIATVSVGRLPEPADADPQTILDDLQNRMMEQLEANNFPTDYVTTETTVCGLTARKHTRAASPSGSGGNTGRSVTNLDVISKVDGDVYWTQLVVGTQPGNPADERDAQTIVDGFQVLPPPT